MQIVVSKVKSKSLLNTVSTLIIGLTKLILTPSNTSVTSTVTTEVIFLNCLIFMENGFFGCLCGRMLVDQYTFVKCDMSLVSDFRGVDSQARCCSAGFLHWQYAVMAFLSTENHGILLSNSALEDFSRNSSWLDISKVYQGTERKKKKIATVNDKAYEATASVVQAYDNRAPTVLFSAVAPCFQFWCSFQKILVSSTWYLARGSSHHCLYPCS